MPSRNSYQSVQKAVEQFRLFVASVILRNPIHILGAQLDIAHRQHVAELCEQYCLNIFINWLGTKYGFPTYRSSIRLENEANEFPLNSWEILANQYPFYSFSQTIVEKLQCREAFQILETLLSPRLDLIGTIYEQQLAKPIVVDKNYQPHILLDHKRRVTGEFYTPPWIVSYCLKLALSKDLLDLMNKAKAMPEKDFALSPDKKSRFKMLDPACGTGNFLIGTMNWLKEAGFSVSERLALLKHSLYGIDVDGRAVCLAKAGLLLSISDFFSEVNKEYGSSVTAQELTSVMRNLTEHLIVSDSLHVASTSNLEKTLFKEFDLVASNPPYISFGSRNHTKKPVSWSYYIRKCYPESAEYKIRLHSIFQEIAINWATFDGQVVLLLPDAFLTGSYYEKLRKQLLATTNILSFTELPDKAIINATVGRWCIAHYQKKANHSYNNYRSHSRSSPYIDLYRVKREDEIIRISEHFRLAPEILVARDKNRFKVLFSKLDYSILHDIEDLPLLNNFLRGHTGIRSRYGQSSIIANSKKTPTFKRGITSGSQVTRHMVIWNGMWINVLPRELFAGGYDKEIIENPKLLIRQTADRLIVAYDNHSFYHLNNVHSFSPTDPYRKQDSAHLYFFDGLMNSSFWLYLYQIRSRESGRALAQIDIEMVESMPTPSLNHKLYQAITKLIASIILFPECELDDLCPGKLGRSWLILAERTIDRLVYDLYGLSEEQVLHIEKHIELTKPYAADLPSSCQAKEQAESLSMQINCYETRA